MIFLCYVHIVDCSNDGPGSSLMEPQLVEQKRQRERERYAQMSTDEKGKLQARKLAAYQQTKSLAGNERTFNKTKHINDTLQNSCFLALSCHLSEKIEARRAKDRLQYAHMTPKQKSSKKALRALRRNSLNKESIAIENPCWTPEVVHTNVDTSVPRGTIPTWDWSIPEFNGTPIYIQSALEQMSVEESPDLDISNITRRKHVTPGERHALLGLRNETFYANSKKQLNTMANENPSITMEGVDGSERPTQSVVTNNGNVHI